MCVAEVERVFSRRSSPALKCYHLQHSTCTFMYSVISYTEKSGKNYLDNRDECAVFYMKFGLETPKRTETRENSFYEASSQVGMDLQKVQKKAELKECKNTTLHLLCTLLFL